MPAMRQPATDAATAVGAVEGVPKLADLDPDSVMDLLNEAHERMLTLPSHGLEELELELEEATRVTPDEISFDRRLVLAGQVPAALVGVVPQATKREIARQRERERG